MSQDCFDSYKNYLLCIKIFYYLYIIVLDLDKERECSLTVPCEQRPQVIKMVPDPDKEIESSLLASSEVPSFR